MIDLTKFNDLPWYAQYAINAVSALIIFFVALWVAAFARKVIIRTAERYEHLDKTLFTFLGSFARYGILALAGVFILGQFGVETTSLAAIIGAAGIAIGLAFQGTLSNFAAGIMLLAFRPIKIGDYVQVAGLAGTVREISIFTIELATIDNVQIIIPNSDVWASAITNYSAYPTRRVDLVFGVSYATDLKKAENAIRNTALSDPRCHTEPEMWLQVTNLGDFSVDFTLRVWCSGADYWNLKNDLMRAVKEAFDAQGIDIPFPTRTVLSVSASEGVS